MYFWVYLQDELLKIEWLYKYNCFVISRAVAYCLLWTVGHFRSIVTNHHNNTVDRISGWWKKCFHIDRSSDASVNLFKTRYQGDNCRHSMLSNMVSERPRWNLDSSWWLNPSTSATSSYLAMVFYQPIPLHTFEIFLSSLHRTFFSLPRLASCSYCEVTPCLALLNSSFSYLGLCVDFLTLRAMMVGDGDFERGCLPPSWARLVFFQHRL